MVRWQSIVGPLLGNRIIAHLRNNVSRLVQHSHATLQFRKNRVVPANIHRRRLTQILLNHPNEIAVKVPILDTVVVAIANEQQRLGQARVQRNAVTGVELSLFLAGTAEGFYKITISIKFKNEV